MLALQPMPAKDAATLATEELLTAVIALLRCIYFCCHFWYSAWIIAKEYYNGDLAKDVGELLENLEKVTEAIAIIKWITHLFSPVDTSNRSASALTPTPAPTVEESATPFSSGQALAELSASIATVEQLESLPYIRLQALAKTRQLTYHKVKKALLVKTLLGKALISEIA